jgi:hypothetical protein
MDNGGWYNAFNMREVLKSIGNRLDQRLSRNAANRERKLQRKQDQNAMHEREMLNAMNQVLVESDRALLPGQRRNEVSISELKAAIKRGEDDEPVVSPAGQYVALSSLAESKQLERRLIIVNGQKTLLYKFGTRV